MKRAAELNAADTWEKKNTIPSADLSESERLLFLLGSFQRAQEAQHDKEWE
jgi:hypothetical protein